MGGSCCSTLPNNNKKAYVTDSILSKTTKTNYNHLDEAPQNQPNSPLLILEKKNNAENLAEGDKAFC